MNWAANPRTRRALGMMLTLVVLTLAWRSSHLAAMQRSPAVALQSAGIGVLCQWTASRLQIGLCLVVALALRFLVYTAVDYFAGSLSAVVGPASIFSMAGIMLTSLLLVATKASTRRYDLKIYAIDRGVWNGAGSFFGRVTVAHQWMLNAENIVLAGAWIWAPR